MLYPAPNVTGLAELAAYNNAITGDLFGWIFVMGVFTVAFIAGSGVFTKNMKEAAVGSSLITFILSALLWSIGLISELAMLVFGVIFGISMATLVMKGD